MTFDELFFHYPTAEERGETIEVSEREFNDLKSSLDRQMMNVFSKNNQIKTR